MNVPDEKLEKLGEINKSERVVPAMIEFVDIAGIVKGASEGAGLGNKFLANIRMTDAIVHVVRCFIDNDIIHGILSRFFSSFIWINCYISFHISFHICNSMTIYMIYFDIYELIIARLIIYSDQ